MNKGDRTKRYQQRGPMDIRIWIMGGILLLLLILVSVFAQTKSVTAKRDQERVKLVTSIQIQKGDTLWSIASEYITEEYDNVHEYIEELKRSNGLESDRIRAGNYIIVPYYTNSGNLYAVAK